MRNHSLLTTICLASSLMAGGCGHRSMRTTPKDHVYDDTPVKFPIAKETPAATTEAARLATAPDRTKANGMQPKLVVPPPPAALPPPPLPLAEKKLSGPTLPPPLPQAGRGPTISGVPAEAPLPPPPVLPELLPPSATKATLQPMKYDEPILVRERAASPAPREVVAAPLQATAPVADLRTLTGEVQQFRRTWRLRYSAVDVADPHGGSVALVGPGLERLTEGARVRVTGTLVPAEDRLGSARFQVQSLEVFE